ncbi:hypothetical protein OG799_00785 [Micromonospora sp. NBC_00898]|nr:hypothetical protein OG799_00785 [Micromonospora sp. NBC_00898]
MPPGGIHAIEELAAIVGEGRELTEQEWTELYARHDQYEARIPA